MAYLANWRLAVAADLLRDPGLTVAAVARRVGYGDAFALSTAFKRVRGLTPQEHRRLAASAEAGGAAGEAEDGAAGDVPAGPSSAARSAVPPTTVVLAAG